MWHLIRYNKGTLLKVSLGGARGVMFFFRGNGMTKNFCIFA